MKIGRFIKKPLVTEKTMALKDEGKYVFVVDKGANKQAIAQELKMLFGVDVVKVTTSIVPGKPKRVGRTNRMTKTSQWKKAEVQLADGQKIDMFDKGK